MLQIDVPTLLIDQSKVIANIERMVAKANQNGVQLRPHFKTHQSAEIGGWFRQRGVKTITVSSLKMAQYFAQNGWDDITLAFLVNPRQMEAIDQLAAKVNLGLLVDSQSTAVSLAQNLKNHVNVWIKVDAGYGRTGILWTEQENIYATAQAIVHAPNLTLKGLLTHAGNSYATPGVSAIQAIYDQTVTRLNAVRTFLAERGTQTDALGTVETAVSIGDTPGCSVVENFEGVDEIRPGNFVFYDLVQQQLGACSFDNIAVGVACPVVAKDAARQRIILYGGAVHLSKDVMMVDGGMCYGRVAHLNDKGWTNPFTNSMLISLSQEHGIVTAEDELFDAVNVGDLLLVLPVHSCLTVDLYSAYTTFTGKQIPKMRTN